MDNPPGLTATSGLRERSVGRPPADDRERPFLVIDMSKMDPEIRESIAGDWKLPRETPQERADRLERCKAATAEYDAEFGPLTPEEKAWADAILDGNGDWMDEPCGRRRSSSPRLSARVRLRRRTD